MDIVSELLHGSNRSPYIYPRRVGRQRILLLLYGNDSIMIFQDVLQLESFGRHREYDLFDVLVLGLKKHKLLNSGRHGKHDLTDVLALGLNQFKHLSPVTLASLSSRVGMPAAVPYCIFQRTSVGR